MKQFVKVLLNCIMISKESKAMSIKFICAVVAIAAFLTFYMTKDKEYPAGIKRLIDIVTTIAFVGSIIYASMH